MGAVSCVVASPGGGHHHGFRILLSQGGCQTAAPVRYAMLVGDYNASFEPAPQQYLHTLCPRGTTLDAESREGLSFPGRASAACRREDSKGWLDIVVVAGWGSWPKGFGMPPSVPHIYYTAFLHTRLSVRAEDLRTFKQILATVRTGRAALAHRRDLSYKNSTARCWDVSYRNSNCTPLGRELQKFNYINASEECA